MHVARVGRAAVVVLAVTAALGAAGCSRPGSGSAGAGARSGSAAPPTAARVAVAACPSPARLRAALPPDTAGSTFTLADPVLCSGTWAVANPHHTVADPQTGEQTVAITQLFHWVGDGWQPVDRVPLCADGVVPSSIYQLTCNSN